MALSPEQLYALPDSLVDMYGLVEIDILTDMARRISTYDYFIPAALHQNQKLQELGMVQSEIIEKLSALTGQSQEEIVALLTEATQEAVADDIEYYTRAEVYEQSEVNTEALYKQLNNGLLQTEQSFFNITQTTANTATKQFERALDRAWTQINVGGMDYNTAIKNAITDLGKAGVGSIEYKSGRIDNIEVAVRRAVVTGANQTAMRAQTALADELGVELVEVTAHGGARPSHAKWQGQVFSRNGRVTIEGVTYEDLSTATGYGRADGLGGVNCRHNFHPYVHGTSRSYSKKDLKELDAKKIEYNGETYTEYEATQIQRRIERDIRAQKRTIEALEAGGQDASAERAKLRDSQKEYTDFTKQTGIRKQSARTQVPKADTPKNIPNAEPTNTDLTNNSINDKMDEKKYIKFDDGDDANTFFYYDDTDKKGILAKKNSSYGKWKNNLSNDSKDALYSYTADGYGDVNSYLRQADGWENINATMVKDQINKIDEAIENFELKDNLHVQRGAQEASLDMLFETYDIEELSDLVGKTYTDKGYMSSTVLYGNSVATTKPVVFDIDIPAGRGRGAYINEFGSQYQDVEYEFLIKHGAKFTITEISEDIDLGKTYVKMVMQDD